MEAQRLLLAILLVHKSNLQVLHWKAAGQNFGDSHVNVAEKYYDKVEEDIDGVAERLMMQGGEPLNYMDVIKTLKESNKDLTMVPTDRLYTRKEVVKVSQSILGDIVNAIIAVLKSDQIANTDENIGIKSWYESLLESYDLEYRYLNARRLAAVEE